MKDLFLDFAAPHKVLERAEVDTLYKLCEVGTALLEGKAKQLVAAAEGRPILYAYGSDCTPMLTKGTFVSRL
eukprot:2642941-Lingulodinium_polyedra.AAC.1